MSRDRTNEVAVEWLVPLTAYVDLATGTVTRVIVALNDATECRPDEVFVPDGLLEAELDEDTLARNAEEVAYSEHRLGAWPPTKVVGTP
jgi:hypothetical protein